MVCNECQNIIDDFIHGRLELRTAYEFAEHIRTCDNCYNELEINYCMQSAITELHSDDRNVSGNYTGMLKETLRNAIDQYKSFLRRLRIRRSFVLIAIAIIGLITGMGFM